jgi:mono/diheme cytochrome c family protein
MRIETKRVRSYLPVVLGTIVFFGAGIASLWAGGATKTASLEQGKYLVESVTICFECHSERDYTKPGWPIPEGHAGGGRILRGEGSPNQIVAPNITPNKETGIGNWSDEEIIRAVRDGVGKNGRLLNPEMPSRYFHSLDDAELRAIVLYLRSIPPVDHRPPDMAPYVPGKRSPNIAMDSIHLTKISSAVKRGAKLVRLAGCETCHTPTNEDGFIPGLEFVGGNVFRHGDEVAVSSDLTPGPSGIGHFTESQFQKVMRTGRVGHRALNSAMPWYFYRHLTDADLRAIFAYLQALPPVKTPVGK